MKKEDKKNNNKTSENQEIANERQDVAKTEEKAPAEKKRKTVSLKKEEKTVPAKKLPGMFKKTYTEKKLEKKIYKNVYIADDKKYIKTLFKESGKNKKDLPVYSIPKDLMFTKKQAAHLKTIAKEIKSQKGRIRWIPLIATVAFIAAVITTLSLTKNIIARKAIKSTCETIFEAKCDIDSVNVSFINSFFKLHGLEIANKNEPMKNLVQIDSIIFDFDMLQLLKARFVANELSINGVETNTDRKTSGDISAQLKAKIERKKAKKAQKAAKKTQDSAFMKTLTAKSDLAMTLLKDSITGLFDQYNPENITKNIYAQLQTPEAAKQAEADAKALVAKYQAMPAELGAKVNVLKTSADEIAKININDLKANPAKIQSAIETINKAYTEAQNLKTETENLSKILQTDFNKTKDIAQNLQSSIQHDTNLVSTEISKITSLRISDGKKFITGTFDNIAYQVLGKYYPYAKQGTDYLIDLKKSSKDKPKKEKMPKKEKQSTFTDRYEGRTINYKNDEAPKFWIKKAAGSGANFSFDALNITNDMDRTGKPATANVQISFADLIHSAKLTVDTRESSKEPLILANYNCDGLPLDYPTSKFGDAPGVPGIKTDSNLDFVMKIYEDDGFDITGTGIFTNMDITAIPFEPAFASDIYRNVLAGIKETELSTTIGYTVSGGLNLNLYSDIDKQFIASLNKELLNQLTIFKAKAEKEIIAKINELSGGALGEINSFEDIKKKLTGYADYVNTYTKQLEAKKKEAENLLNKAVDDAKNKATDAAKKATDDATKKATDAAKEKLKGFLR